MDRASRRNDRCSQCSSGEDHNYAAEGHHVRCTHMEEQTTHPPRQCQCSSNADHDSDASQCHPLAYDQTDDVTWLRSQRQAQANVTSILAYKISKHAENTNCRERKGEDRKSSQQ